MKSNYVVEIRSCDNLTLIDKLYYTNINFEDILELHIDLIVNMQYIIDIRQD